MRDYDNYIHSEITSRIIKEAYHVFNVLGYGFLESVYERSLEIRLKKAGFSVSRQQPIKVFFEDEIVGNFDADIVVNDTVIVELKATQALQAKHEVQLVNYLKATEIEIGLLINFGEEIAIKRRIFSNFGKSIESNSPPEET